MVNTQTHTLTEHIIKPILLSLCSESKKNTHTPVIKSIPSE